ncbi:gp48 baseplate [Acinetobacter phage Acj61]|uniref:Gp48 baseplate n=1 Tax=Acinetobacter phage Acj61 TaxID=760732 RepID=E5E4H9_9CAUD|nr:baseplate tail tube cap [Acinetobacter phage Acj61]ADG36163.1 gp48 baseplate [Acinetobacter phage Acj61]
MLVKEIVDSETNLIERIGSFVAAGRSSKEEESKTKIFEAQYPDGRAAATDSVDDARIQDLYANGLLFTAVEYKGRTTPEMTDMRGQVMKNMVDAIDQAKGVFNQLRGKSGGNKKISSAIKNPVCQILLPRSKTDTDTISHKFNDVNESLITRGNGTATGILSNLASTAVFGAVESISQGVMADHGEQIYNTSRAMYGGAENRTKTYTWELTPRTEGDLVQIIRIYELFSFFSYGVTGNSAYAKEIKGQIDDWYKKTFINNLTPEGADRSGTMMESVTSFLSNVIVVSNPTVWFIQNFGTMTTYDKHADVFGPAQISNIRFDKAPDGNFSGLAIAPNMPSTFVLEITFREILTLNRGSLYGRDVL